MPMHLSLYPANWREISIRIRERDGNRCKECGVPNGVIIQRSSVNAELYIWYDEANDCWRQMNTDAPIRLSEIPDEYSLSRPIRVVLTVAHLYDDTPANCADDNLASLCQLHHLRLDGKLHAQHAAITRSRKKQAAAKAAGQKPLW
jgi:hypothetical protein